MTDIRKKKFSFRHLAGIAAAFVLLLGGIASFRLYQSNFKVVFTVSLDVNPSIEILVNEKERVVKVNARNQDAQIVIGDMDFKGSSLDIVLNALINSMLRNGYLNEIANSILVSVDSQDSVKCAELQTKLADEINALLQNNSFDGAILSQTLSTNTHLQGLADSYGITLGKAQLIQQIISQNTFYSFEDLVSLSINELNLLSESGNLNLNNIRSLGAASDKAYIGETSAWNTALSHAGLSENDITHRQIELDYENGSIVYELEFKCQSFEYEYDIDAVSGIILKQKKEQEDNVLPGSSGEHHNEYEDSGHHQDAHHSSQNSSYIGNISARGIACSHAGVSEGAIYDYKCELDDEDGAVIYEVEFKCDGYEYEYDIDAISGAVLKHEKEWDD